MKAWKKLAAAGAVVIIALTSSPASAADFSAATTGARANWDDSANRLTATDTASDGQAGVAQLRRPNGSIETVVAAGGTGTSKSATYPNITEDDPIEIRACRRSNGVIVGCGAWVDGFA